MTPPDFPPQPWITFQRGGGQQIKDADEDVFAEVVCYPRKREIDTSTLFAAAPKLFNAARQAQLLLNLNVEVILEAAPKGSVPRAATVLNLLAEALDEAEEGC